MKRIVLCLLFVIVLFGCASNGDTVSRSEYEKVVKERDHYKELYDKITGNPTSKDVLDIELTKENVGEYFELIPCDHTWEEHGKTETLVYIMPRSKLFEEGWVYRGCSSNFKIEITAEGDTEEYRSIRDITSRLYKKDGFSYEITKLIGQVRFERIESLQQYEWDTFNGRRVVKFADGHYDNYPILDEEYAKYKY